MISESLKKEKGITLVALVVTIVVLLILAGVSLNLVLDNNGIITKAGEAKDRTEIEAIKEAKEIFETEKYLGATEESLADYLYTRGLISVEEKALVNAGGTIIKGNYSISFAKTAVEAFKDGTLKIGDWVNYQNPTKIAADVKAADENYTDTGYTSLASRTGMSIADGNTSDIDQVFSLNNNGVKVNWRVLGLSADGTKLMLISGTPLRLEGGGHYYDLRGAKGTALNYGIAELNKICAMYKNELAEEARSINIDDVTRLCNISVDIANKKVTTATDTTTNITTSSDFGESNSYTNGFETPEAYIENSTDAGKTASFSKINDGYYFSGSSAISESSELYNVLFKDTSSKFYWLASRAFSNGEWGLGQIWTKDLTSKRLYLFKTNGNESSAYAGVRPVIVLRKDVTIEDINKNESEPTTGEEAWPNLPG